jgi:hypothetical protein
MLARWAITEAGDMSKESDFLHIVAKANALSVQIQEFLRGMSGSGGPTIPHALRSDIVKVMLPFSAVRSRWVSSIVERGVAEPRLRDLHCHMRTLARVYARDDNTLEAFLDSAWKQMLTQSAMFVSIPAREAYCAKAFLCMASAFICGLKFGPAPLNPNALDATPVETLGGASGMAGAGAAPALPVTPGTPQGTVQWPLPGMPAPAAPPAVGAYAKIQQGIGPRGP